MINMKRCIQGIEIDFPILLTILWCHNACLQNCHAFAAHLYNIFSTVRCSIPPGDPSVPNTYSFESSTVFYGNLNHIRETNTNTTMATQTALMVWDFELEMCANLWIVELSRNSHIKAFRVISTRKDKK